jgi:dolichyl-phosphate-mannose--protein O-mannosyl transferase
LAKEIRTLVAVLLLAGLALHFFRLGEPGSVIFDEVHFGRFADSYCCSGAYIFDVHPPHGKLLAALGMKLGGYDGGQSFESIATPLTEMQPWLPRLVPALLGSLIPVLVFAILHQLGASLRASFLAGWAVLFDNALLLQTRVLALDGIMIFSMLAAIGLALLAVRQARSGVQVAASLGAGLGAGLCIGMAVGTKFTGLTSAAVVGGVLLLSGRDMAITRRLGLAALAGLGAAVVYLGGWVLHFILLDQPGPGDIWGRPSGVMWHDIVEIHRQMLSANYGLTNTHPNASPWWAWPLMWRPIYYFAQGNTALYLVGNPVVWWGAALGMVAILWWLVRLRGSVAWALPLGAFLVSYLPYAFIPRILFLYHYLPSLVFAVMAVALWLDRPGREGTMRWLLVLIPLGFVIISPFTYGFPLPEAVLTWMRNLVH